MILKYIINKLLGKELDISFRSFFLKGSAYTFLIQICLSLLTFFTTILLARLSGEKGLGVYTVVFTWVGLVYTLALFGLDDFLVKNSAVFKGTLSFKLLVQWSYKTGFLSALIVSLAFLLIVNYLKIPGLFEYRNYYNLAIISIPFFVLLQINQAILRGLGNFAKGQLPEKVFQPTLFVIFLLLFYLITGKLLDFDAVICRTLSFLIVALISISFLFQTKKKITQGTEIFTDKKLWFNSCIYFTISTVLYALNTRVDILMLSLFEVKPEYIAHYNVALKFSDLALIPYMVICTVSAPIFSSMYHKKEFTGLQNFYTKITKLSCIALLLIILPFILFGNWFLSLYGDNFKSGYFVLILLCITKFIHVVIGPANYLLNMTGNERFLVFALLGSVLLNIILQIILIPLFVIEGSAIATLISLLFFDITLAIVTFNATGVSVFTVNTSRVKNYNNSADEK
jgi:O-antigen/teichoic acid export membrane protein